MIAAKWGDPVLGIDIHAVIPPPPVPPPGPPTPLPHPFVGVVFDPMGAAVGAAMGAIFGGGGPVVVNGMLAGNVGTDVKGIPHIPTPPGVGPHPTDAPTGNDGSLISGSKTVHFGGDSESRTLSVVMSCSYPLNLPTSLCMAVPMGSPVLIGGPEAVDFLAAATSAIRTKWVSDKLHGLLKAKPKSWTSKAICFLTGHPVDVMTGELIAEATDFDIPGLIPIVWERNYRSRQTREGALGPGWSHPFDEVIEESADDIVLWLGDGRPKTHRRLGRGDTQWDPEERYTIERTGDGYEVLSWDGVRRLFRKPPGAKHFVLVEIRNRARNTIRFTYDRGYLVRIEDTAGRQLEVAWTQLGRMEGVYFEGKPLTRYAYDAENRLSAAIDPLGHALRYEYRGGVLVKETHKTGLTFFFEWDWDHPEGWCVKTWGENPTAAQQPGEPEGVPRFIYVRKIRYVPEKHFTSVEDGRGGITQYWGNALGLVDKEMDPGGVVTEYSWDANRRKLSETDGEGNRTEWEYDDRGNLTLERNAIGAATRRRYDEANQLVEIVESSGGSWKLTWGPEGKLTTLLNPSGVASVYQYDAHGRLIAFEDAMGRTVRASWTDDHNLASAKAGPANVTEYEYDALGRVMRSRDANGRKASVMRDAAGRVTRLERADGAQVTKQYDPLGNVVEQVDSQGRRIRQAFSGMGRLVEYFDAANHRVRLIYDAEEELVAVENQAGERYRFEMDRAGRVKSSTGFDGRKSSYVFDKAGRTTRVIGPDHVVSQLEHDPLGRLVRRVMKAPAVPNGPFGAVSRSEEETFSFDAHGEFTSVRSSGATVTFERDVLGRVVNERQAGTLAEHVHDVTSRYDHSGLRIERETSLGHRAAYDYDAAGELSDIHAGLRRDLQTPAILGLRLPALSVSDWEMKISRDSMGLELARRMPGGVVAIWKRDSHGRPISRELLTGAYPGKRAQDTGRVGYEWQGADELVAKIDSERGTTRYEYDPRGHLVSTLFPDGELQHRTTDAVSNVYRTADGSDREYGRGGRLLRAGGTEFRYDGHGNLVEKVLSDGARWRYLWTPSGRLAEVQRPDGKRVAFEYDALGRRVRKEFDGTVTTFVWDGDDLVHEVVTRAGERAPLTTWIFEPGMFRPVAKFQGRQRYSVMTDYLGAPTELLDEEGALAWKADIDVYGRLRETTTAKTSNPWRYPGQYEDAETGLYYNRFRYYDPDIGRFISIDPAELYAGIELYSYVKNPRLEIDAFGLWWHDTGVWITEGGNPRFDSSHNYRLPKDLRGADVSDFRQMKAATEDLRKAIRKDPDLAADFTKRQLKAIEDGKPRIPGLTWHHHENGSLLQLVDRKIHAKVHHEGGRKKKDGGRC